ncbi:MAG: hypothetical protein Q8O88_03825 [bacterium]|nr:hypothetical protein [bacterium]
METCPKIPLNNSDNTRYALHYGEAFKLDMNHYKKVLKAKWERGILNEPTNLHIDFDKKDLSVGDFIEGHASRCGFNRTVYGFVKTCTANGFQYIEAWEARFSDTKRGREYTFFPQRYYLKNMNSFRIVYKKYQS